MDKPETRLQQRKCLDFMLSENKIKQNELNTKQNQLDIERDILNLELKNLTLDKRRIMCTMDLLVFERWNIVKMNKIGKIKTIWIIVVIVVEFYLIEKDKFYLLIPTLIR